MSLNSSTVPVNSFSASSPVSPPSPTSPAGLTQSYPTTTTTTFSPSLTAATPLSITTSNSTVGSIPRSTLSPHNASFAEDAALAERNRRVSYAGQSLGMNDTNAKDDIWGAGTRTLRAGSDGALLGVSSRGISSNGGSGVGSGGETTDIIEESEEIYEQALFRENERRSLENSARLSVNTYNPTTASNPLTSLGHSMSLLSPTSSDPAQLLHMQQQQDGTSADRSGASLHLGDLDVWMDEAYVKECCARMGWEGVLNIKMIRGASPSSGYCFLTFPSAAHAAQILARFASAPPMLMPRSARVFKLNWGTGLPGVQPRWEGEYSVFVGDLGREVGEAELVTLFTPLFSSTKSAKIMYDPSTGISRGYGFVRFADENDMHRALTLGQNPGSGLSLHGRTLRISEASGPGNALDANGRARSRSGEQLMIQTNGGYPQQNQQQQPQQHYQQSQLPQHMQQQQYQHHPQQQQQQQEYGAYPSPSFTQYGQMSPTTMRSPAIGGYAYQQQQQQQLQQQQHSPPHHTTDPNNTTVFVGGLPACISEETLKSFFHHFGEITYCKIPTGKGCGFVQFVRRADAELAIAKMNDFPIHGKSRIRLSWGRSQGDKQVEHVRKLASALGVPFEAVWRMVQGQENQAMKQQHQQVANSISGNNGGPALLGSRFDALGMGRMELGAVAAAAGLSESEVMDLVGGRTERYGPTNGRGDEGFFTRSAVPHDSAAAAAAGAAGGNYARVSPSTFSAFSSNGTGQSNAPATGGDYAAQSYPGQQQQQQQQQQFAPSPYANVNSNAYAVPSPTSHYERVDFANGGVPRGGAAQGYQSNASPYDYNGGGSGLEESFSNLGFASSPLPPRDFVPNGNTANTVITPTSATSSSTGGGASAANGLEAGGYLNPSSGAADDRMANGAAWGAWSGASSVQA